MKQSILSWEAALVAAVVIVVGICAQSQHGLYAEERAQPEGKIVRISPDADGDAPLETAVETETTTDEVPTYWIGISGRDIESPVLRTQLQLAEDMGVAVEAVVPGSPAEKAGLRKHDIILRANGVVVDGMQVLQAHVRQHQAKPIELKLLRLGKEETIVVVPEERPKQLSANLDQDQGLWNGADIDGDAFRDFMERFQQGGGIPGGVRMFGPGIFLHGQQLDLNALPNGVLVSIQRENDQPAKITVKQGDKTWTIEGDDPAALDQLPDDVRPFVERMLQHQDPSAQPGPLAMDWEAQLENFLPRGLGGLNRGLRRPQPLPAIPQEEELTKRLERMEQQLQELQKQLSE